MRTAVDKLTNVGFSFQRGIHQMLKQLVARCSLQIISAVLLLPLPERCSQSSKSSPLCVTSTRSHRNSRKSCGFTASLCLGANSDSARVRRLYKHVKRQRRISCAMWTNKSLRCRTASPHTHLKATAIFITVKQQKLCKSHI